MGSTVLCRSACFSRPDLPDVRSSVVQLSCENILPHEQYFPERSSFRTRGWVCRAVPDFEGSLRRPRQWLFLPPPYVLLSALLHIASGTRASDLSYRCLSPVYAARLFHVRSRLFGSAPNNCVGGSGAMACLAAASPHARNLAGPTCSCARLPKLLPEPDEQNCVCCLPHNLGKPEPASLVWTVQQARSVAICLLLKVLFDLVWLFGHAVQPDFCKVPKKHLSYLGYVARAHRPSTHPCDSPHKLPRCVQPNTGLGDSECSGQAFNATIQWGVHPRHPLRLFATVVCAFEAHILLPELLQPFPRPLLHTRNSDPNVRSDHLVQSSDVENVPAMNVQGPCMPPSVVDSNLRSSLEAGRTRTAPTACGFQVMCPMHRAECVQIDFVLPISADTALAQVGSKLQALNLEFATTLVPVQPQPVAGYATLVLSGDWLEAEGNTIVVYDLRAMGGPLFAQHLCLSATYGDVSCVASRFGLANWHAFAFGSHEPVGREDRFRSLHGGLIKFVPHGAQPVWGCSIHDMLRDPTAWHTECPTYWESPSQATLVITFDHAFALRRCPFDTATLRASIARHEGVAQARLVLDRPCRGVLEDVLHHGEPCSSVIAAREAPVARDRQHRGFCVFLDPRQVGRQVCKLHLSQPNVTADYLARFAGILRVPQGFECSFCADRATSGDLVVQDGDVITFGFVPLEPAPGELAMCPGPARAADSPDPVGPPQVSDLKLLQEPSSSSRESRDRIEQVREDTEVAGRVWPYLPADDDFAQRQDVSTTEERGLVDEVCRAVFVILTPAIVNETVAVLLSVPATVDEAVEAVNTMRNGARRQLYPHLGVVQPQPFLDFGTLYALPEWCPDENAVCFNLIDWDGRFYVAIMPTRFTREDIIQHAGIAVPEAVNVYVGTSVEPLADAEWTDLTPGLCLSFYPRHKLPGAYFFLHDMLLSAATWATAPVIPAVPESEFDRRVCVVKDAGCCIARGVRSAHYLESDIAAAFHMQAEDLLFQESVPPVQDAAINGWPCQRLFGIAEPVDPVTGIRTRHVALSFIDCRPLLQGWSSIATASGAVRLRDLCRDLMTFCPPGYRVFLLGVDMMAEFYHPNRGQVVVAAFVLCSPAGSMTDGTDDDDDVDDDSPYSSASSFHEPPYAIDGGSRDGSHSEDPSDRSRSPRGRQDPDPVDCLCFKYFRWLARGVVRQLGVPLQVIVRAFRHGYFPMKGCKPRDVAPAREVLVEASASSAATMHTAIVSSWAKTARIPDHVPLTSATNAQPQRHLQRQLDRQPGDPPPNDLPDLEATQEDIHLPVAAALPATAASVPFLLFTPDYCPATIAVDLMFPITVQHALERVQAMRTHLASRRFPTLHVVDPQPLPTTAVLIALPEWCSSVYVLIDCSRFLGTLFCMFVSPRVTYESLLTAAGIDVRAHVAVFVGNGVGPFQPGQAVDLQTGDCISIVARPQPPYEVTDLQTMLLTAAGWGPAYHVEGAPGRWICLLTDTEPTLFQLRQDRRQHLRADVAQALGRTAEGLTIVPSQPRLVDYYDRGYFTTSIGLATFAPEMHAEAPPIVYFIDARPILCDLAWGLTPDGVILVAPFLERFQRYAPAGFYAEISGVAIERTEIGPHVRVHQGGILTVDFVPAVAGDHVVDDDDSSYNDAPAGQGPDDDVEHGTHDTAPSAGPSTEAEHTSASPVPGSDTSANGERPQDSPSTTGQPNVPSLRYRGAESSSCALHGCPRCGWISPSVFLLLVRHLYQRSVKPVLTACLCLATRNCRLPYAAQPDSHLAFRDGSNVDALQRHRIALDGPPAPLAPLPIDVHRDPPAVDDDNAFPDYVDAVLVTLTPGYCPDIAIVPLELPATVPDVQEHLRDVRDEQLRRRFPAVVPAVPQPYATFATFVAMPAWAQDLVLIVFHVLTVPTRVFSSLVLPRSSREDLLVIAGFGTGAHLDVFVAGGQQPLRWNEHVDAFSGATVTIQPPGGQPPIPRMLQHMLASDVGWDAQATIPFVNTPALWLVTDRDPCRFPLDVVEVADLYQALADYVGYDRPEAHCQASEPRISDFEDLGFGCSAVAVVTRNLPRPLPALVHIIFCDLRPILKGFTWCTVAGLEISVAAFVRPFVVYCPIGYQIVVEGAPVRADPEGQVLLLAPGKCMTVEFVERVAFPTMPAGAATYAPALHTGTRQVHAEDAADSPLPDITPGTAHTSRSSGHSPRTDTTPTASVSARTMHHRCTLCRVDTWIRGFYHDALSQSILLFTSVLQSFVDCCCLCRCTYSPHRPCVCGPAWSLSCCALRRTPGDPTHPYASGHHKEDLLLGYLSALVLCIWMFSQPVTRCIMPP